ncbi:MAG: GNAT family N-acetyltransferase [Pseudomonadota bacterium]
MSVEIRIATSADAVAACAVLRRSITECCLPDHRNDPAILDAWLGNKTAPMVAGWFASSTNYCLVALDGEQIVGVALLTRAGKICLCYLLPESQGRGIGRALLQRMELQASAWDIKTLQLHSTVSAERFYARQGYLRSGMVKASYGADALLCWKDLGASAGGDSAAAGADPRRKRFCKCNSA